MLCVWLVIIVSYLASHSSCGEGEGLWCFCVQGVPVSFLLMDDRGMSCGSEAELSVAMQEVPGLVLGIAS